MHVVQGSEFQIIQQYFERYAKYDSSVALGIGDDCALINATVNTHQAISVDTSIGGVHFPEDAPAYDIAYRALNVSLSDLAAMGAYARWFTLALTLPDLDHEWLTGFSQGLFQAADNAGVQLIGGDTTRGGSLSITVQVQGEVPAGQALKRMGAKAGDYIYVSGTLGNAGAGLAAYQNDLVSSDSNHPLIQSYLRPEPCLNIGVSLRHLASSCIDVSDGLLADLNHILKASSVGAEIDLNKIPLSDALLAAVDTNEALSLALTAGDDYQLCFTSWLAPDVIDLDNSYCIGKITANREIKLVNQPLGFKVNESGYDHFHE